MDQITEGKTQVKKARAKAVVWIVVVSKPGQERRAKRELEQQGFEIYLPMKLVVNRKRELIASPFFPRYMFARVSLQVGDWRAIWSTYGVQGLLGSPTRPHGVADAVVERIQAAEESGFIKMGLAAAAGHFAGGQRVRMAGSDALEGIFLEAVDEKRAAILVSLLGRDSRVTVDLSKLRAAEEA
jgi:transcriptional antiterminator RfaH